MLSFGLLLIMRQALQPGVRRRASLVVLCALITTAHAQSVITTIAGTDWLFPGNGLPAINAPLSGPLSLYIAVDSNGSLYIADAGNSEVMRVGRDGILTVIAGNGISGYTGNGGLAISAALSLPISVAVDAAGNVYIGGYGGDIRKVTSDGIIRTIAGDAFNSGFSGDGGPAVNAQLYGPYGLAVDSAGNVFIADYYNNRVRKIGTDGIIHTVAGGGSSSQDGVPGTSAQLNGPTQLAVDSAGNVFIADTGNGIVNGRIRKLDGQGMITTVAGGGNSLSDGVPATTEALLPLAVALDAAGNLYIADDINVGIRKVNGQGVISTIAGNSGKEGFSGDGGPALQALFRFSSPALAVDGSGSIYFADNGNSRVRKITPDGKINTVAGNGLFHFSGNNGPAASATLDFPTGIVGDQAGNIYFTEPYMNRIRRIAPDRTISVVAGTGMQGYSGDGGPATYATLALPEYLAIAPDSSIVPAGSLVFSDHLNCVIRAIDPNGIISTIAGVAGNCEFNGDLRPALQSHFFGPSGVAFDGAGDLLIAETEGQRIRGIVATGANKGLVLTLAGNGTAGYSGDGSLAANKAQINQPAGLRPHGTGVYFCDTNNNAVRFVDFNTDVITTVAGNGTADYSGDGGPATKASLHAPSGLAFDAQGNVYIADTNNSLIRKVDTNGIITTFAGTLTNNVGDGGSPLQSFIGGPEDLFFDASGNLIFTDGAENRIREVLTQPPTPTLSTNPSQLAFTAAAGSQPQNQSVSLTSVISGSPVTVTTTRTATWLSVSFSSANLPASLQVIVNPSALAAGNYQGTVTISSAYANPANYTIPVALTVTAAGQPSLSVSPNALTFTFVRQAPAATRPVILSNVGGGTLPFNVLTKTSSGGAWLRISSSSGVLPAFGSLPLNVTADPTGLGPGTYSGAITIGGTIIPVTMIVTAVPQTILIPQTGLSFYVAQGGGAPTSQSFNILNTGVGIMPWTISASTISGGPWLSTFPQSGQTDASVPLIPVVGVDVDPTNLAAGTYYGTVKVSAPGATNNPQFVSVVLTVLPPGSRVGPIVQPTGLIFAGVQGAQSPGAQTVTVQSTGSTPVTFTSSQATISGFTTLPTAGTITPNQPQRIVIQPDLTGLTPGIYRGALTLSFSDGNTRTVSLVLVVIPSGTTLPAAEQPRTTVTCKAKTLAPVFTQLASDFSVTGGFPTQVSVKVIDDCANPMTTGGVTVGFDNGDPPVRLTSLNDGNWAGTWTPQHPAAQVLITANASVPAQNLTGQVQIRVGQQAGAQAPLISSGGVVNAASFAAQAPLAPGSLVSLFGTNLAAQGAASSLPLPASLGGSSVQLGNTTMPLLFTSGGQVNAIVPYGMSVNTTQQVIALRGSSISVPEPITVAAAAPGVFTSDGQQAIAFDGANLVSASNPAKAGDTLVIYCTGLGEVSPSIVAGAAAPLSPLFNTVNTVTATMGGIAASVQFAGLTPGFAGLYQVNAVVPAGIAPGNQLALVLTAAGQSSAPVTIAVR